jgi:endonuclease YncB( thermonuclease family)
MRGPKMRTGIVILTAVFFTGALGFRYDRVNKVKVRDVESGDTFIVSWYGKPQKARLIGIDAPDRDEPLFEDAKKALAELIKGKLVEVKFDNKDSRPEFDTAGRWVCIVYLDKKCINEDMVKKGYARINPRRKCDRLKNLESMQNKAKCEKLGIWGVPEPGDANKKTDTKKIDVYVGWKHDKIYHRAGCRVLDKYKPEDIIVFSSKDEAQEKRKPCPVCIKQKPDEQVPEKQKREEE